jgi:hypothetical protein
MKQISIFAIALAVFSLQPVASAQTSTAYMTVDAVQFDGYTFTVTGVVQGESTPSTRTITFTHTYASEARGYCQRLLLLALSKPGQYVVQAGQNLCNVALVAP